MFSQRTSLGKRLSAINLAVFATSMGAASVLAQTQNSTWVGPASSGWSTAAAWSPSGVPNNGTNGFTDYNVTIGAPAPAIVNGTFTIDNLTVGTSGQININVGNSLNLNGAALIDNGSILINTGNNGGVTELNIDGSMAMSGTGSITLNAGGTSAQLDTGTAGLLTVGSGNTINGLGNVGAALTNNGTVNANIGNQVLSLFTNAMTNNATFESSSGGTLNISGITVTQGSGGTITAGTNSAVQLSSGATITGGTLASVGNATIQISGTDTIDSLTNNAQIQMHAGNDLNVNGNLVDNGSILVNTGNNGGATTLTFNGGTVSGTGTITLNSSTTNAQLNGSLTQSAGHSIVGFGEINAAMTNNGTVDANVSGNQILLQTNAMTNNATFESSSGGTLNISGITVTQGLSGAITAGTNSAVQLSSGTTITGGTLASVGNATIQISGTDTIDSLTNNAQIQMHAGNDLNVTGNLVDNGSILVNTGNNGGATTLTFNGGTVSGTGTITLNSSTTNAQLNGSLTQSAGHTINGFGEINAALTNNGTVNANISSQTLFVLASVVKNNLMETSSGGILDFDGLFSVNNAGGQITAGNGTVDLQGGVTIVGGTLNATSPSTFSVSGNNATSGFAAVLTGGVTISTGTGVNLPVNNTLEVTGSTLTDNGDIDVNPSNSGGTTILTFNSANTLLTGSGTVILDSAGVAAQLNTGAGDTITQDVHHTISGFGDVGAALTNNGTVNANISSQTLSLISEPMTNNATFESSAGGTLNISGITVTQGSSGTIAAGTNSTVALNSGATITGGTLASVGNATIQIGGTDTITSLTNNANIRIPVGNTLDVIGNLVNNGSILVNSANNGNTTILNFAGTTVTGTGTITLNSSTTNAQLNGSLTQGAGHTINGFGEINATLFNNGTVDANVSNQVLYILNATTNTSLMEATGGGTLDFDGLFTVTNAGGQINGSTGEIALQNGVTISGGTLSATAPELVTVSADNATSGFAAELTGGLTISAGTQINLPVGNTLAVTGSTLTNNGEILVNSGNNGGTTILTFNSPSTLLTGTGTVVLNAGGGSAQLNTGTGDTLTQDVHHTISGFGDVGAALTNNGTVNANIANQALSLITSPMTNNATFESSNGGTLNISGITVTQGSSGTIAAGTNSAVQLSSGTTITGGTLASVGNATIQISGTDTISNLTNNANIQIHEGNNNLDVTGNLVDNGSILVNTGNNGGATALTFNGGTLSGTGTITLNAGTTSAQVNGSLTQSAGHTINGFGEINATLVNNGTVDASVANQTLLLTGNVTGTGALVVGGSAQLTLAAGTGLNKQRSVSVGAGGSLDLTNNALDINYGAGNPSPISTIQSEIISGYNGGSWNGAGIRSSSAAANHAYAVGYADGSVDTDTPAVPGQILTEYTLVGDVNLDGTVNLTDLLILLNNYGLNGRDWAEGDMNYDGTTNLTDLLSLLNNYGLDTNGIVVGGFQSSQVVPEPVSGGILMMAAGGTLMSRRRRANVTQN